MAIEITFAALWVSGQLLGSQFLGGVVGNLVGSVGYDLFRGGADVLVVGSWNKYRVTNL